MADDQDQGFSALTNMAGPGGAPLAYSPQAVQQAYFQMLRQRRQQQPLQAYYHPLAAVSDVAQTFAEQLQMNRLMQGAQAVNQAATTTVPQLPGGDGGAGPPPLPSAGGAPPAAAPPQAAAVPSPGAVPRIPGYEPSRAASLGWVPPTTPAADYDEGLKIAKQVIESGPRPPGGASMNGPGASYSQIMGGPPQSPAPAGGAAPVPAPAAAQPSPAAPASALLPAEQRAREEYKAAADRAKYLKTFPPGTPEHAEGIKLEEELQKQRMAPSQVITNPRTGESQRYDPLTGGQPSGLPKALTPGEGEAMSSELKSAHTTLTGVRGLGVTGSNIEPYTAAAVKIVSDPSFQQTGLISADNQLFLERLKKQLNLPSSATPLGVLNQIQKTVLNGMQSGAKSFSTEGGEAARLFTSEIETMKGELPPTNATRDEQIAGWNSVHRRALKWGDDALYFNDWVRKQPNGLPTPDIHSEIIKRNRAFKPYDESAFTSSPGTDTRVPGSSLGPSSAAPTPSAPAPAGPASFNQRFNAAFPGQQSSLPGPSSGPAPTGGSIMSRIPGPGITAAARTGIGLPAQVPPMPPASTFTSDVTRKAREQIQQNPGTVAGITLGGPIAAGLPGLGTRALLNPTGRAVGEGTLLWYLINELMGGKK